MVDEKSGDAVKKGIRSNLRWILFWSLFFLAIGILLATTVFSQNRTDTGDGDSVTEVDSLTCESDSFIYPFFEYDDSDKKEMKIITTFVSSEVRSISLQQMLYYKNERMVAESEAINHAAVNKQFGEDGMGADSLNASYSQMSDRLRFGLYAEFNKLNTISVKYFLLGGIDKYDYDTIKKAYGELGLECSDK